MSSGSLSQRAVVVCPVVPYPAVGGSHKRTLRLLEAMDRAGAHPHIVTADHRSCAGVAELRSRGWDVDVLSHPTPQLRSRARQHLRRLPSPYLTLVAARIRELSGGGSAFVQLEHTQSAYYGEAIAGARCILSLHNVDSRLARSVVRTERPFTVEWVRAWNRWHAMRSVERRAVQSAEVVLCVSDLDREALEPLSRKVLVVPNGVDESLFAISPVLPREERVLFFGQFDYRPNAAGLARFLQEGWPELLAFRPAARLRLAGAGMAPDLLRVVARTRAVEPLGFVPDVEHEIAASRLVIVPIWAGGGTRLKVLESLAAARPLAGTPLGVEGIGFEHDRHGLVAETPLELARASASLLADTPRSLRLAAEGRRLAERFRWSGTVRPAEELYARWLSDPLDRGA